MWNISNQTESLLLLSGNALVYKCGIWKVVRMVKFLWRTHKQNQYHRLHMDAWLNRGHVYNLEKTGEASFTSSLLFLFLLHPVLERDGLCRIRGRWRKQTKKQARLTAVATGFRVPDENWDQEMGEPVRSIQRLHWLLDQTISLFLSDNETMPIEEGGKSLQSHFCRWSEMVSSSWENRFAARGERKCCLSHRLCNYNQPKLAVTLIVLLLPLSKVTIFRTQV